MKSFNSTTVVRILFWLALLVPGSFGQQPAGSEKIPQISELLGKWQGGKPGDSDVLDIKFKNAGRTLLVAGRYADWEGTYVQGKLKVIRRPRAQEMHSSAPLWARELVANATSNHLVWELELEASRECGELVLKGNWFPGELEWEETKDVATGNTKRSAKNSGSRGKPVPVEYVLTEFASVAGPSGNSAVPGLPDDITRAHRAYVDAKENEKKTKRDELAARQAVDDIERRVNARFDKNVSEYDDLMKQIRAIQEEALLKYKERAEAAVMPTALTAEYKEYKRRYEILKDYRQYLDDAFFRGIEDKIRELGQQMTTARSTADQKVSEIDRQLDDLRRKKLDLDKRLAAIIEIPAGDSLSGQWLDGLAQVVKASQDSLTAENEVVKAFDRFIASLGKSTPPYVKNVTVSAGGQKVYAAEWKEKSAGNSTTASQNSIDTETARLRAALKEAEADIADMEKELRAHAATRLEMTESMKNYAAMMVMAAEHERSLANQKILSQAVIEAVGTIIEVMLTGGAATAARKATELAAEEATTQAVARAIKKNVGTTAGKTADHLLDEMWKLDRLLVSKELEGIQKRFAQELTKKRLAAVQKARQAGGEAAARRASEEFDRMAHGLTSPMTEAELKAELQAFRQDAQYQRALAGWAADKATTGVAKFGAAGAGATGLITSGHIKVARLVGLTPEKNEAWEVVWSDSLEVAFQRGLKLGVERGRESLAAAGAGPTWQQVKSGSRAFFTSKANYAHVKDLVKIDTSLLVGAVTTLAKAGATVYFNAQERAVDDRFIKAYAELETRYQIYYASLAIDKEIWDRQQELRRKRAEILGQLAQLAKPRELKIATGPALASGDACIKIELQFSTFLIAPPAVILGGRVVTMLPAGPAEAADRWIGQISAKRLVGGEGTLSVSLNERNKPFALLDRDPATAAYVSVTGNGWIDYEAGADQHHKFPIRR